MTDTPENDFNIKEHNGIFLAIERPPELPNKPDRDTFYFAHYQSPYTENGIVYVGFEQDTFRGNYHCYVEGNRSAKMTIITAGQYWGTREFWIHGKQIETQDEFERRVKLAAFE